MNRPLFFSVVIPTYNRAQFIENTLQSVFEQTYPHYEIIVVDDYSTDNTAEILKPYVDAGKITLIKHSENLERAYSRNTGMENAHGDFLTLLDSDDFMFEENLSDAARFVMENTEIKVFHNLYDMVDSNRKKVYKINFPSLKNQLSGIANGNFMACIGNFLHRDVYTNYRFDTFRDLSGGEDWEFWLRVLADFKLGRINRYNSGLQHHSGRSVNSQNIATMERGLRYLVEKFKGDAHLAGVYGKYLSRIEASSFLYLNFLANDSGLHKLASDYLRWARRADSRVVFTNRFLRSLRRTVMGQIRA